MFATKDGWVSIMHDGIDAVGINLEVGGISFDMVYTVPFLLSNLLDKVFIQKRFLCYLQPKQNHARGNVLYFVAFLLLAGFVVLNMLVGVVVENFKKCRDLIEMERDEEEKERAKEEQKKESKSIHFFS